MQTDAGLSEAEVQKFKRLASQIEHDAHLERLLAQSSAANRLEMYESIKANLTFKPKPYWWFSHRIKKTS